VELKNVRIESNRTVHPKTPLEWLKVGRTVRIYESMGLLSFAFPRRHRVSSFKFECPKGKGPARFELFADNQSVSSGNLDPSTGTTIVFPQTTCGTLHFFYGASYAHKSIFLTKVEID